MEQNAKTILIVDDRPDNLRLVTAILKPYYDLLLANTGERAIHVARERKPDLILLDIMMPGMSGFDVCKALKGDVQTEEIPVIFLTAKNDGSDFEHAYDAGGVDYITKPVNAKELLMRVRTHLLLIEQRVALLALNKQAAETNDNLEVEVKKRTHELYGVLEKLEKQNADLARFSHIISHNLRGPVASVIGLAGLFNRQKIDDPGNGEIIERLNETVVRIDQILKDVSHLLRIRESQAPPPIHFSSREIIDNCLARLRESMEHANPKINLELEVLDLFASKEYVEQILLNLIENALIFYSTDRQPEVIIKVQQTDAYYLIAVEDNGIGIDARDTEKVFEPFKRLNYNLGGRGLGLYIVKAMIEALHGHITLTSKINQGSVFQVSIPRKTEMGHQPSSGA
jgi:two-component system sensor histidine kinase/response regulator